MKVIKFDYTDKKGVRKEDRVAWVICRPSDKYFAIDLTEFSEDERAEYITLLDHAYSNFLDEIREIGLGSNFRYFFENKVELKDEE